MTYPHQPENIKVCPECGTNLIYTARHCAVCGYQFTDIAVQPVKKEEEGAGHGWRVPQQQRPEPPQRRASLPVTINLPVLFGLFVLFVVINVVITLGLQKRGETKTMVDSAHATGTYVATTYVSPTPSPTATRTPAPPTETPVVDLEYTVVEGDSCLSIVRRFKVDLDTLVRKNDIDCSLLKLGTVLRIPPPTPTPEPPNAPTDTAKPAAAP